jgi:hypothetical protein
MPNRKKYKMNYRPKSYFADKNSMCLANIKGEIRRRTAIDAINSGSTTQLEGEIGQESLQRNVRDAVGRVHPAFMGGEYLPDSEENEVEIARVTLKSTTVDVFSVRARNDGTNIHYRVVDEYDSDFSVSPEQSESPLTFGELIALIDGTEGASDDGPGLTSVFRNQEGSVDVDFVKVTSIFYPELQRWYREEAVEEAAEEKTRTV